MTKRTLIRAVLDTNILVAAARSEAGASHAILQALLKQQFTALISVPLILEYEAVLKRPEHLIWGGRTIADTDDFLDAVTKRCIPIDLHYLWRPQTRDPADEMVLETALNGRADVLVTLNVKDFDAAKKFGILLKSPSEFLQLIRTPNLHILKGKSWPTTL